LTRSLSVLLPVHNAQATLQADVGQVLDLLPDLSHDFDLLIIDDGSTDATCEVAEELAKQFPQVKLVRHSRRRGIKAALNDGLSRTRSHIVLGHDGQSRIDPAEIVRVWHGGGKPLASNAPSTSSGQATGTGGSFHLLRRDPAESTGVFRTVGRIEHSEDTGSSRAQPRSASRRSNFLRRLKDFAVGE
jgi:glycosyltransferase involved in cell wall biosynthesis